MTIYINGDSREVPDRQSISGLVELLGLDPDRTAVEINRELVPRARHEDHRLESGDEVEIVTLVGGG